MRIFTATCDALAYNSVNQPHSPCRPEVSLGKGWRDDEWRNINRINPVHYAGENVNYDSELTTDLPWADGQLPQA